MQITSVPVSQQCWNYWYVSSSH